MSKSMADFLEAVCSHVRCKEVHESIKAELSDHIRSAKEAYVSDGLSEAEAEKKAVADMGGADDVGKRLNWAYRRQTEWSLIAIAALMTAISGLMIYRVGTMNEYVNFSRFLFSVLIGVGMSVGLFFLDYRYLKKISLPCYIVSLLLSLGNILLGYPVNERNTFVRIGSWMVLMDFVLPLLVVAMAGMLMREEGKGTFGMIRFSLLALLPAYLFLELHSLRLSILVFATTVVLLVMALWHNHFGSNRKLQIGLLTGGIGAVAAGTILSLGSKPYRMARMGVWLSRGKSDPYAGGWQMMQADRLLSSARMFSSSSSDGILPDAATNYAWVSTVANLGWWAGGLFLLLALLFAVRLFLTARKIHSRYGTYLISASATVLSVWLIMGIGMNLGVLPIYSGIPFLSYGGTGFVTALALLGIALSVWRQNRVIGKEPSKEPSRPWISRNLDGDWVIHWNRN